MKTWLPTLVFVLAFLMLAGCHEQHGSASYDGMSHIKFDAWPFAIDCDGSAPRLTPKAITKNFDAMCSFADDFFQNECTQGVGSFGIEFQG